MLTTALKRVAWLRLAGTAGNVTEALVVAAGVRPDLVLLDIKMPGACGWHLIAPLREILPAVQIVMLSAFLDPFTVLRVLESRVDGYVEKGCQLSVLLEAIHCVRHGGTFFSPGFAVAKSLVLGSAEAFHKILSQREQEILRLVARGLSDDAIALHRSISVHTVATRRKRIRAKLDVHSDRELLAYAQRWGLACKGPESTRCSLTPPCSVGWSAGHRAARPCSSAPQPLPGNATVPRSRPRRPAL
jgi:DNA-binding NarL/FixJ family response regulator